MLFVVYKYRYSILYGIAKGFVNMYILFESMMPASENKIKFVTRLYSSEEFEIHKYHFFLANKVYDVNIIKGDKKHRVHYDDMLKVIEYKNAIVYCGLEMGDVSLDLTNDFRKFVYHFDKDDMLECFFKYIKDVYKYEDELEEERNGIDFVVFFNDDDLTQYNHKLQDVQKKSFRDLLKLD
jgi:hypothetical protein